MVKIEYAVGKHNIRRVFFRFNPAMIDPDSYFWYFTKNINLAFFIKIMDNPPNNILKIIPKL